MTQDTQDNTTQPPTPQGGKLKPMRKGRRAMDVFPLIVSLVALMTAATVPVWQDAVYGARDEAGLVLAEKKLASLAEDVTTLREQSARREELAGRVAALEVRQGQQPVVASSDAEELSALLASLEQKTANLAVLEHELKRTQEQMAELARQVDAQKGTTLADKTLVVVLLQLFLAWQNGESFEEPWKIAMAVAQAADPRLAALMEQAAPYLEPMKDKGLPSVSSLQSGFSSMAHTLLQASRAGEGTWWQQALANVKGLVSIRRQGAETGEGASGIDAALAQAEAMLGNGNLAGVVQTMKSYTATGNQAVQSWMAEVQAREAANTLSSQMVQHLVQKMLPPADALPDVLKNGQVFEGGIAP